MRRICEVCGRIEEVEKEGRPYDILDVCPECSEHTINRISDVE
ncbi:hypothetical protein [Aquibacillus albus]|uniref:RNA-binding Zn-ribbon protein involved in translation (DUF1610 family) n=1 Tax=Aquibacillus albus TaxID=1168171 RepID=A0ABS2MY65_9BACI|nr:hypothetical protein [Aquibacillus albus]MBM7570832.1 putative RNA-binding Zn-ribbon protein involved in translation (DUF1610 family) [Aquibacillus albus]